MKDRHKMGKMGYRL